MKNKRTKTILIGMVAVLVMAIGVAAVFAQTDDVPSGEQTTDVDPVFHGRGRGHGGFPHGDPGDRQAELAEALGISVEELQAAQQEVRAARINQLVEDGTLTLDQANLMLAMDALKQNVDRGALMQDVLGLSAEEFEAAREDGSLRDILSNITPAELQERMQAAFEAALDQAVEENVISADQAELVREHMADGAGFGGHGRPGGFGGHGRGNFAPRENLQNSFAPSV